MVRDGLTTREQAIHQNNLIMQREDQLQLQSIVLRDSLNLLVKDVNAARLISLRHSVNGNFCGHSRFVLWHENLTTFVS